MTTAIDAVTTRPSNTPSAQRSPDDSQASFAQLFAPLALISGPTSSTSPLAPAANANALIAQKPDASKPAKEKSARSAAQDLTSDAAITISAAASQRLFEGRGAEKPNEVNIAGRAAAELASHGEPVAADQPAPDAASRSAASRQTTTKPDNAAPDASQSRATPTADSSRTELITAPIAPNAASAASAPTTAHATSNVSANQAAPVQGVSPNSPRQTTAPAAASSATAPASAVSSAARSSGADAQSNRHDHSAAARTRMWARLERLGQRPPAPANAAGTRSTDRAVGPDSTIHAQFARGLAAALKQRDGHLTLRLNPENLGNIRVDLSVQADRITASIAAADEQARRLLSADVVALRTALEATGLNVERIEVVEAPAEPSPRFPTEIASHTPTSYAGTGGFDDPSRQPNNRGHGSANSPSHSGISGAAGDASSGLALDTASPPSHDLDASSDLYVLRIDLIA